MPDGPEIDIDRLQETVHDPPDDSLLRNIALTTALLAAFGAVAALRAGGTVNEALVLKTEAGRLQAEASDQWAYYQAKGIKANIQEGVRATWSAAGKTPPATLDLTVQRYAAEQKDIERVAREKEHQRDEKSQEADQLLVRHHRFANAVALLQVAIALGAVAALTRQRVIWLGSGTLGLLGVSGGCGMTAGGTIPTVGPRGGCAAAGVDAIKRTARKAAARRPDRLTRFAPHG